MLPFNKQAIYHVGYQRYFHSSMWVECVSLVDCSENITKNISGTFWFGIVKMLPYKDLCVTNGSHETVSSDMLGFTQTCSSEK
jgi:hypothetical protein